MYYAIMAEDIANSLERRMEFRPQHLARLTELQNQGRLLLAGPFPAIDGGICQFSRCQNLGGG
jgi:uncharacterized protein